MLGQNDVNELWESCSILFWLSTNGMETKTNLTSNKAKRLEEIKH